MTGAIEMTANPLLSAALDYAAHGWAVLPLWWGADGQCACGNSECSKGKHPIGGVARNGVHSATTNAETIREWWRRYPNANIGVATGEKSGFDVLDVDIGEKKDGQATLEALQAQYGELPATVRQRTGSGGGHLLFRHNPAIKNRVGKDGNLGLGLDTRATGGYIVVAPSVNVDTGRPYEWLADWADHESIAEAPDWLVRLAGKQDQRPAKQDQPAQKVVRIRDYFPELQTYRQADGYAAAALRNEVRAVAQAPEGQRNHTLNKAAFNLGQLVAGGELDREEVESALLDAAFQNGLAEREAVATINSGLAAGERDPRKIPERQQPQTRGYGLSASEADGGRTQADTDGRTQQGKSRLLFCDDIDALPAPRFLIDGFLPENGFSVVYGAPGSFKTFIALDMAMTVGALSADEIQAGRTLTWHGRHVEHGAVVYVYAEGAPGIRQRITAWRQKNNRLNKPHSVAILPASVNLRDPANVGQLVADIQEAGETLGLPVRLVVLDTLFRCFGGGNLNGPDDMGIAVGAVGRIMQETGAAVLAVHHDTKSGDNTMFGSQMLLGSVDASLKITRNVGTLSVGIAANKMKDGEEPAITMTLEAVDLSDPRTGKPMLDERTGAQITSLAVASASEADGGRTQADKADTLNSKQANALQAFWDWLNDHGVSSMPHDEWAAVLFDRGVTEGPRARKQASELKGQLDRKGRIRIEGRQIYVGRTATQ